MPRVTIRMTPEMIEQLDDAVDRGLYPSRSEAVRASIEQNSHVYPPPAGVVLPDGGQATDGTKRLFKCPDCGNEGVVTTDNDSVLVLLGCSDGHDTKDMVETTLSVSTDTDR